MVQGAEAQQVQYVMQAPQQGVAYAAAPQPVTYVGASGSFPMAQPVGQIQYIQSDGLQVFAEGQQIQYIQGDGQQVLMEGQEIAGAPTELAGQFTYAAPQGMEGQFVHGAPMVVAAPARVNVSHEIFAKLAAGGTLTPEEMAQLSGQPAPAPAVPGSPQAASVPGGVVGVSAGSPGRSGGQAAVAPGSAKASGKKDKKDKTGSKTALKASKKKKEKGCC